MLFLNSHGRVSLHVYLHSYSTTPMHVYTLTHIAVPFLSHWFPSVKTTSDHVLHILQFDDFHIVILSFSIMMQ